MACNPLLKEAIEGIDFRSKLDDTLASLDPKMKMSPDQLKGYLLNPKRGVTENEIKQSMLTSEYMGQQVRPIEDYIKALDKLGNRHRLGTVSGNGNYDNITLDKKGIGNPTYKESLTTIVKPLDNDPGMTHFASEIRTSNLGPASIHDKRLAEINNELDTIQDINSPRVAELVSEQRLLRKDNKIAQDKARKDTLLGWRRTHEDTINGKKTTVLNEFQSDWAQTGRNSGRGIFKKAITSDKPLRETWAKQMNTLEAQLEEVNAQLKLNPSSQETQTMKQNIIDSIDYLHGQRTYDLVHDFPMSEKSHSQFQIVSAIDEAIKSGTNRVAIPIQRENELVGTEGVTKFYDSLNKSILPEIRQKLETQGMRLKVSKETYGNTSKISKLKELEAEQARSFNPETGEILISPEAWEDLLIEIQGLQKLQGNTLHVIEIEHIPTKKVKWDIYSMLGGIGLTGLADKLKEEGQDEKIK